MSHADARLNLHGKVLLVRRIRQQGWAVAHAAKAQGVSRQTVRPAALAAGLLASH